MIETILIFVLGFFVAGFLALMAAPAIWRRATYLTKKRIEASMPLSLSELEADKDHLRAEHAMRVRKLEMTVEALNRKFAKRLAETGQMAEDIACLTGEHEELEKAFAALKEESESLRTALAEKTERADGLSRELEEARAEIARLRTQHEEERLAASSRQVELAARESEVQKLEDELGMARNQRREAVRDMREATTAQKAAEAALRVEERRNKDLQQKLETLMTRLSDREERLERRESEIVRLRGQANGDAGMNGKDEASAARTDFEAERERLQARLSALLTENGKLRKALDKDDGETVATRSDDALRAEISTLAAEMVNLTSALEGPGSPVEAVLAKAGETEHGEGQVSLAERVRALREGANS